MQLRLGFDIIYRCEVPTEMLMMLSLHPSLSHRLLSDDRLVVTPTAPVRAYIDGNGNLCHRLTMPAGTTRFQSDFLLSADDAPEAVPIGAPAPRIADLPDDALIYLLPSRYCEVDKMLKLAKAQFGDLVPGWPQVAAVLAYSQARLKFDYKLARPDRSALEAHEESSGVCRDFAHLSITLCRALGIPARYATGWLGDIRWPRVPGPQDVSGWTQVWLAGQWWDVDARHITPRHGRVLMAVGRDAADVALSTAFGDAALERFHVISDEVNPPAEWLANNHEATPFEA